MKTIALAVALLFFPIPSRADVEEQPSAATMYQACSGEAASTTLLVCMMYVRGFLAGARAALRLQPDTQLPCSVSITTAVAFFRALPVINPDALDRRADELLFSAMLNGDLCL